MYTRQNLLLALYGALIILSLFFLTKLRFTFDFEQFFPKGDPDWEFFKAFTEEFENDDNFLLIAAERSAGVFDSSFLAQFHDLTVQAGNLPNVTSSNSLTKLQYPVKTPFGITALPVIHTDQPDMSMET